MPSEPLEGFDEKLMRPIILNLFYKKERINIQLVKYSLFFQLRFWSLLTFEVKHLALKLEMCLCSDLLASCC